MQDAYYQLVYYPVVASAGVAEIYNHATMGDSLGIENLMRKDQELSDYYNNVLAEGKWKGMMMDNHIGYTKWSNPNKNRNPMTLGMKVEHPLNVLCFHHGDWHSCLSVLPNQGRQECQVDILARLGQR